MQTEKYLEWAWVRQLATVVPCILCLATTVWSSNDERALGAGYWPRGMCGALSVQGAGRQGLKEGWQAWAGRSRQYWKMCMCPVQERELGHTEESEGWSRGKGYLGDFLKGRLEIVEYGVSRCMHSIYLFQLLLLYQTLWNLCRDSILAYWIPHFIVS